MLARLLQGVAVVLFAASITFFLIKALPGYQFSERSTNPNISAETLARFRARSGNDEPLLAQYWIWISSAAQGDLNRSDIFNKPVARVIGQHLPATLQLMSLAFVASMVGGIALGTWQGTATGSRAERLSGAVSLALVSIPEFWLAMILLLVFAINVHWFPTQGMSNLNHDGTVVGSRGRALDRRRSRRWLDGPCGPVRRGHHRRARQVSGERKGQKSPRGLSPHQPAADCVA